MERLYTNARLMGIRRRIIRCARYLEEIQARSRPGREIIKSCQKRKAQSYLRTAKSNHCLQSFQAPRKDFLTHWLPLNAANTKNSSIAIAPPPTSLTPLTPLPSSPPSLVTSPTNNSILLMSALIFSACNWLLLDGLSSQILIYIV